MNSEKKYHIPVLFSETILGLKIKRNGIYVDCTLGGGGHFREIARLLDDNGVIIGVDRDSDAIAWVEEYGLPTNTKTIIEKSRFSNFDAVLDKNGISKIDGILADLGVSSYQLDEEERGFSYQSDAELDMRMDRTSGKTAAKLIEDSTVEELATILQEYGEIRNPKRMSATIKVWSDEGRLSTTADLTDCIKKEYGENISYKVLSKLFQALRIAVNGELDELKLFLEKSVERLAVGGRLVVISYHSLEDRIVKRFIRDMEKECECPPNFPRCICGKTKKLKRISRKAVKPSDEELVRNSRSRSARLRIAERVAK